MANKDGRWANFITIDDGISWTHDTVNFGGAATRFGRVPALSTDLPGVLRRFGQTAWGTVIEDDAQHLAQAEAVGEVPRRHHGRQHLYEDVYVQPQ